MIRFYSWSHLGHVTLNMEKVDVCLPKQKISNPV